VESTNCGQNWIDSPPFDNFIDRNPHDSPNNITKWRQGKDKYRTAMDIAAVYDLSHQLHVFFNGIKYDEPAGETDYDDVKLFHWSKNTEQICGDDTIRVQLIQSADWDCKPGGFNLTLSKPTAGVGITPGNSNHLYLMWVQFNENDLSAGGYTNGELYVSKSTTDGQTWDAPRNITNTSDPGCVIDECDSDHWGSLATRVDSFLHIQYINDRDPGGIPLNEGDWTYSPVLYYKYPDWTITALPRIDWVPKSFTMPNPIHVPNNGSTNKSITINNLGTDVLSVYNITGPPWVQNISPTDFSIEEGGCPVNVSFDINAAAHSEEMLVDELVITSDDAAGNDNAYIPLHVIVSDVYLSSAFAAVYNNSFYLTESNVGNISHKIDSASMTFDPEIMPEPEFGPVFDGSVIIGTATSPARVGRYMFNERYMLAESELKQVEQSKAGIKVAKAKCNPAEPLPPYAWKWWWLTVEYYDYVFTSGTATSMERFIKKWHIKVYKNPKPPWWDPSDVSTTNDSCLAGIAVDFDLPSDTGAALNTPGFDESLNLLYQQGFGAGNEPNLFAGIAWVGAGSPISGIICPNEIYVYPQEGYLSDSLWSLMSNYSGYQVVDIDTVPPYKLLDYNQVMTGVSIPAGIADTDTFEMQFLIVSSIYGLDSLKSYVQKFECGNADRVGSVNLGDARAMANDFFGIGDQTFRFLADVNGDCRMDLADIIILANYYFGYPFTIHCSCEEKWP